MIKVWYTDFWGGWNPYDNWFSRMFLSDIPHVISPNNPDLLIFSCFGNLHEKYVGSKKIYWTGENTRPPLDRCDLAMGFDYIDHPKYERVPLYAVHYWNIVNEWKIGGEFDSFLLRKKEPPRHSKFCAFIYGNASVGVNHWGNYQDGVEKRNRLFQKLNSRKKVDSMGSAFNNTGFTVQPELPKIRCISDYKFTFAIENSSYPGYVTEKIMDPMAAHSVPLYWGSERVDEDFTGGFVNLHKMTEDDAVDYILELDSDPKKYEELYYQPYLESMTSYFDFAKYRERIRECVLQSV